MNLFERVHDRYMRIRRMRILSEHLAALIPKDVLVLDVGCGDGLLAQSLMSKRPDIKITGIDLLVRRHTRIPVVEFDGKIIPYDGSSFDVILFIDVLHHTIDPMILINEAMRITRRAIVIKDHSCNGLLAKTTLQFMDWVGNARCGVSLPYNYWSQQNWLHAFNSLDLRIQKWIEDIRLYPPPANWIFGRSLHFIARLSIS